MPTQRLWIISELYYPEQTSTGYFLTHIAEGLSEDFLVAAVCGQPTYSEHGVRAPSREQRHGVTIHRVRATRFAKDRLFFRAINLLTFSAAVTVFGLLRFRRGDRLLIVTNPPILPPVIGLLARWRGIAAYLLVHDVYPEVIAAAGLLRRNSLAYRILDGISSATLRLYKNIVVIGRDMEQIIIQKRKSGDCTVSLVPNWADIDEVKPIPLRENAFASVHAISAETIIQYSGNIGRTHDADTILAVARRLRARDDITFLFVGQGGKAADIGRTLARDALANVRLLPRQPRAALGAMLACATATVIPFVADMKGLSVPSRMYNVLASGTPIIALADPGSELALTVAENDAGWVLQPGDVEGLARLVEHLATSQGREEAARRGRAGRIAVERAYSRSSVLARFRALLRASEESAS